VRKKNNKNLSEKHSVVLEFLSGKAPSPINSEMQGLPGPLEKEFLDDVEAHISNQDRENESLPKLTALEELMAVLRLVVDNREMLILIEKGSCSSVSKLARELGRELSNVSRTLSKMVAYGLVDFVKGEGQVSKKPVLLVNLPTGTQTDDWAEAYCIARAVRGGGLMLIEPEKFTIAEEAVRSALGAAANAFDTLIAPKGNLQTSTCLPA
jgi:predicted transcriptional regulator